MGYFHKELTQMIAGKNKSVIRTEGLTKKFGSLRAVDALNIEAREGEIFGLLGPNGAGKTTTIKMICGLLKPDKGKIFINGKEAINSSREMVRKVGLCPQELVLWEYLTCSEQMMFVATMSGLSFTEAKNNTKELLGKLNLEEKKNKTARTLSGGLKRRLNLALALVHDPEIIILDEPEAGLDPQSRVMVREFIKSLAKRKTVVFTTHNMDEAERICDRVGIIDRGKLLVTDSPDNLKKSIGEGDILEITLGNEKEASRLEKILRTRLEKRFKSIVHVGTRLILRTLNTAANLPLITSALSEERITLEDIRIRWNSLEDVFINLTGRSLRE
jgi:ABC-2 type transport system ATP-binding protein